MDLARLLHFEPLAVDQLLKTAVTLSALDVLGAMRRLNLRPYKMHSRLRPRDFVGRVLRRHRS